MDKTKLMNSVRRSMFKDHNHYQKLKKIKYSRTLMRDLFSKYNCIEYCWFHYCCHGEDYNCWIDEDVCWMGNCPQDTLNKKLLSRVMKLMNSLKNHGYDRNIYIAETKKFIMISIPLRDVLKRDLYIAFDK